MPYPPFSIYPVRLRIVNIKTQVFIVQGGF